MRKLAERSAQSVTQIAEHVGQIRSGIAGAQGAMDRVRQELERQADTAARAGGALRTIRAATLSSSQRAVRVDEATRQLTGGGEQMVAAFHEIAAVAEENTAASEEIAASSRSVMGVVQDLSQSSSRSVDTVASIERSAQALSASTQSTEELSSAMQGLAQELSLAVDRFRL